MKGITNKKLVLLVDDTPANIQHVHQNTDANKRDHPFLAYLVSGGWEWDASSPHCEI